MSSFIFQNLYDKINTTSNNLNNYFNNIDSYNVDIYNVLSKIPKHNIIKYIFIVFLIFAFVSRLNIRLNELMALFISIIFIFILLKQNYAEFIDFTKEKKIQCVKLSACQTVKPYKPDIGIVAWKASNSFPSLTTFCTARETRSSSRLSNLSRRSTATRCRCRRACTFCIFSKITALTSSGDLVSMSSYLTLDAVGRGSIETSHIDNSRGAPVESSGNGFANVQGRLVLEVSCLK